MSRALATVIGLLACAGGASAGAAPPLRQSFDLVVPRAPAPVRVGGKPTLVYELHLTNFARQELTLTGLEILTGPSDGSRRLAQYRGADLAVLLSRSGTAKALELTRIVPGFRAVAYLWLPFDHAGSVPSDLVHRIEFTSSSGAGPGSTVDGGAVAVGRDAPTVLGPPLRGGPWVAVYDPAAERGHRRVLFAVDGQVHLPARFAIDWMKVGADRKLTNGDPTQVKSWVGYGADVLAVADAVVATARDDVAESATLTEHRASLENAGGNTVVLALGGRRYAFYEHLQPGSVQVVAGERVRRGQVIARLGYTGDSTGPHLHFHVADADAALAAEGVPWVLETYERLGGYAKASFDNWVPEREPTTRQGDLPEVFSVIRFADRPVSPNAAAPPP